MKKNLKKIKKREKHMVSNGTYVPPLFLIPPLFCFGDTLDDETLGTWSMPTLSLVRFTLESLLPTPPVPAA